jgi:hypothetical protein
MAVLASLIDFAIDDKLAEAAIEALQTYQWSKRAAKHPDGVGLKPYVSEMQRVVAKTLNHRTKHEEPADEPTTRSRERLMQPAVKGPPMAWITRRALFSCAAAAVETRSRKNPQAARRRQPR